MAKKRSAAPPPAARREFGPAECAAALKKLHRRLPHITDKVKLVLHWADRTIAVLPDPEQWQWGDLKPPTDRTLVASSHHWLANAIAALDALNLPKETRQENDKAIHAAFTIGRMLGNVEQALSARIDMARARAEPWQKARARKQAAEAEARHKWIREICAEGKRELDEPGLTGWLIDKLGAPTTAKKLAALTRRINRDLETILGHPDRMS